MTTPELSPTQFRFHGRGSSEREDIPPFGRYSERPYVLDALAKTLHAELGLDTSEFINGGGMLHTSELWSTRPDLEISFDLVGVNKAGKGEAVLVSALVHGPEGIVAWTPDLDLAAPGKPLQMGYYRQDENEQYLPAPFPPALKATLKAFTKKKATKSEAPPVLSSDGEAYRVSFSPDGSKLATVGENGKLRIYDAANGAPLHVVSLTNRGPAKALAFSHDGTTLIAGTNTLVEVDVATGKVLRKLTSQGGDIGPIALSPSGKRVASAGNGKLMVWDLEANEKVYAATAYDVSTLAFLDETHVLVSLGTYPGFKRFDLDAKPPKAGPVDVEGPGRFAPVTEGWVAMSLDGSLVVYERERLTPGRTVATVAPGTCFATDGANRLVIEESVGSATALVMDVATGTVLRRVAAQSPTGIGEPCIHGFAFSADGRLAACAGRGVTVWNADGSILLAPRA